MRHVLNLELYENPIVKQYLHSVWTFIHPILNTNIRIFIEHKTTTTIKYVYSIHKNKKVQCRDAQMNHPWKTVAC